LRFIRLDGTAVDDRIFATLRTILTNELTRTSPPPFAKLESLVLSPGMTVSSGATLALADLFGTRM